MDPAKKFGQPQSPENIDYVEEKNKKALLNFLSSELEIQFLLPIIPITEYISDNASTDKIESGYLIRLPSDLFIQKENSGGYKIKGGYGIKKGKVAINNASGDRSIIYIKIGTGWYVRSHPEYNVLVTPYRNKDTNQQIRVIPSIIDSASEYKPLSVCIQLINPDQINYRRGKPIACLFPIRTDQENPISVTTEGSLS